MTARRRKPFKWTPFTPCDPSCIPSRDGEPVVSRLERARRLLRLAGFLAVAVPVSWFFGRMSPRRRGRLVQAGARAMLRALDIRLTVRGTLPSTPTLIVANHLSWVDGLVMLATQPLYQVAKAEIRYIPLFGGLGTRAGTVWIKRDKMSQLPGVVEKMRVRLAEGAHVAVFPEGTTRCTPDGAVMRRASFQAALDAGAAVQPARVEFFGREGRPSTMPTFIGRDDLLPSIGRVLRARGLHATVTFGQAIPAGTAGTRKELAALAKDGFDRLGGEVAARVPEEALAATEPTGAEGAGATGRPGPAVERERELDAA
ncbi:1-acyl-sn-glycerol-3-phosphate acyltransferase [Crossiella equi]|uniref:1-acyl-sn-glycerol-3-phosphate acyltransferase n=1 Tax=Crossiella equi TaxID=130796 RepID=A0ABS5ALK4_9PSEU|nr:lysophospholipid acyltransferase family protein [Crossiella equi]MBP2477454.1 1-acyl-sn-glycerol-3-phosphate acyltransferase [Crossiella equi]